MKLTLNLRQFIIERSGTKYPVKRGHCYTSMQSKNAYNDYLQDQDV